MVNIHMHTDQERDADLNPIFEMSQSIMGYAGIKFTAWGTSKFPGGPESLVMRRYNGPDESQDSKNFNLGMCVYI